MKLLDGGVSVVEARRRLRAVLAEAGGVVGNGRWSGSAGPRPETPFGSAEPVESDEIRAVDVRGAGAPTPDAAFADGIQRYVVEGRIGMTPIVRAHVSAAVLQRRDRALSPAAHQSEEFIVASLDRLPPDTVDGLYETGLAVHDAGVSDREHPILDVQLAVRQIEWRRRAVEIAAVSAYRRRFPEEWVFIDGSLRGFGEAIRRSNALGVIKSHETQFFAGVDLETALTLPEGHRTTVFRRTGDEEDTPFSWYLRLRDWVGEDILFGLVRLEREPGPHGLDGVDDICRWLLAERAPIAAPDARWDRLLYPIREVENYLRAKAGAWW